MLSLRSMSRTTEREAESGGFLVNQLGLAARNRSVRKGAARSERRTAIWDLLKPRLRKWRKERNRIARTARPAAKAHGKSNWSAASISRVVAAEVTRRLTTHGGIFERIALPLARVRFEKQ